ncbi:MAG: ribosome silencing factor [Clostridia bacterium]|nr:ribosome silencing factor [Clostridia bacterium]
MKLLYVEVNSLESLDIIKIAANALNEKKAKEISAVKIADLTVLCEYFLICTATSSTHVRALCDEVEDKLEENGIKPHHIEGRATGWIALDYGSVIIHIFGKNEREFYGLDKMWSDGEPLDMNDILTVAEGD